MGDIVSSLAPMATAMTIDITKNIIMMVSGSIAIILLVNFNNYLLGYLIIKLLKKSLISSALSIISNIFIQILDVK